MDVKPLGIAVPVGDREIRDCDLMSQLRCVPLWTTGNPVVGQVIDVLVAEKRDLAPARRFFTSALRHSTAPPEVSTDRAPAYPRVLDEVLPAACHVMQKYATNPIKTDHGRLKTRLRPMRGRTRLQSARVISAGHAFLQNIRRGHDELGVEEPTTPQVMTAFTEPTLTI
ncbi:MAG: DDE-type integrase/transposase/recombinase [Pseudonocardiales bacterium]|nr:DDE-type integrase/transposase/recombinase [Pseudonocardiales bacterium]